MSRLLVDGEILAKEGERQFELAGWVDTAPFEDLLGMTIEEAKEGKAILSMPFTVKLAQGGGFIHGGALTALADTAVAIAIKTLLPEGTLFATIEMTTRFFAPVRVGQVTVAAAVTGPEGRTLRGEAAISDDSGREVVHFTSVFRVARGQGFDD